MGRPTFLFLTVNQTAPAIFIHNRERQETAIKLRLPLARCEKRWRTDISASFILIPHPWGEILFVSSVDLSSTNEPEAENALRWILGSAILVQMKTNED